MTNSTTTQKSFKSEAEAVQHGKNIMSFIEKNDIGKMMKKRWPDNKFLNISEEHFQILWNTPSKIINDNQYMEIWNVMVEKLYLESLTK